MDKDQQIKGLAEELNRCNLKLEKIMDYVMLTAQTKGNRKVLTNIFNILTED